jgi:hypothetical protein
MSGATLRVDLFLFLFSTARFRVRPAGYAALLLPAINGKHKVIREQCCNLLDYGIVGIGLMAAAKDEKTRR